MTLALPTNPAPPPLDLLTEFQEGVVDWSDAASTGSAAAEAIRGAFPHVAVMVYRFEPGTGSVELVATSPAQRGEAALGSRSLAGEGVLGTALRTGARQRSINAYVRPDFVRSLPGETRSELVQPILAGGVVRGALQVEYPAPHRPTADDETLLASLAGQLAPSFAASARDGSQRGEDRRVGQADRLAAVASHVAQNASLDGVLQRVADTALELVPGACAAVLLRHESRHMLEVSATSGSPLAVAGELIPLDHGVPGQVARDATPRTADPVGADQRAFGPLDEERGIRDAIVVPLSAAGKSYGVLAVLNRSGASYTPDDVEALQRLANQSAAIESMRSIGPLRQRLSDNSLLAEVGRAVTGTLGLDEVLAVVGKAAEMLVSARCAAVALLSEDRETLRLEATTGSLMTRKGETIPVHGSLTGWAVLTSTPVTSASIDQDPRRDAAEAKLGPGVIIPIESGMRVHGALLAARAPGALTPSDGDVDAMGKLAAYAAIAIENARLYREQTELSQKLRLQAEELEKAYAELRLSQDKLLVSEKMAALGRVTAGIAHEINSPLGGILNCLQMAQTYVGEYRSSIDDPDVTKEDHEAIATDLTEALNLAEHSTRKVAQFVRTIKGQTRSGDGELRVEFEPVAEMEGVFSLLQHELRARNVTLQTELQPGLELTGDPGKFSLVVQNLVKNAIDAYEGADGTVTVKWSAGADKAVLAVKDDGCGISESIRGRIYDYLFTTKDIGQGTGLGLSTVHSIMTTHFEGEVNFESTEGVGTTFYVTFPTFAVKD